MNFLAHIYLSKNDNNIMIGNFIADFVKGNKLNDYSKQIVDGILIHREIDRFTDSHEIVKSSKSRLWNKYRHYSSVIVDIYYDHFLSKNWNDYSSEPLKTFTERNYEVLTEHISHFPEGAKRTLKYMKQTDWLYNYQFLSGIEMALNGMSKRATFDSKMEFAIEELNQDYDLYKTEFKSFFPLLRKHVDQFDLD
jgi:acyl carrier protein phosphodiesterase